jgi:DNA-binding beta-propeller fold protein YncE
VNALTNVGYVANNNSNTVTAVYGNGSKRITINVGQSPVAVAVNQITNRIYVANRGDNTVTVINGDDLGTSTMSVFWFENRCVLGGALMPIAIDTRPFSEFTTA